MNSFGNWRNEMKYVMFLPDNFENNVEDGVVERICGNVSSLQCANQKYAKEKVRGVAGE
jgi:hypothetical protein